MIIYMIRHAQTSHNKKGKVFSGISDVPISKEGEKQALRLSNTEIANKTDKIYTSPLKRTKQTADIIFGHEIPTEVVPKFSEMDFGDYEGRILDENSTDDEVFIKWMNDPESLTFPHGDVFREHAKAAYDAFVKIAEESHEKVIAVVSHRTTIRLIITQLLGKPLNTFREIPCDNCAVAEIKYENGKFTVEKMNKTT